MPVAGVSSGDSASTIQSSKDGSSVAVNCLSVLNFARRPQRRGRAGLGTTTCRVGAAATPLSHMIRLRDFPASAALTFLVFASARAASAQASGSELVRQKVRAYVSSHDIEILRELNGFLALP